MVRKIVLGCGIVSSVWYVVTDVLGTLRYPGYTYADYTFSESLAVGFPVRPIMLALNSILGSLLFAATAVGVARRRSARVCRMTTRVG